MSSTLSLYLHIPFCHKKCNYCSFPVIPIEKLQEPGSFAAQYQKALFADIEHWATVYPKAAIKTLYVGGGTPLLLGANYLIDIIQRIFDTRDYTQLEELTIECNPYPYQETLEAIGHIITTFHYIPRLRFSFGIQSLDDTILDLSNRENDFVGTVKFTEDIITLRGKLAAQFPQTQIFYNYDFIAFGKGFVDLANEKKHRLYTLLTQQKIDSYSLYTLELFAGAKRYHETKDPLIAYQAPRDHDIPFTTSEDDIFDEFALIKQFFLSAGYERYEISNYALPGRESIHNTVYRTMQPYLGLGLGAHSLLYIEGDKQPKNIESGEDTSIIFDKKYISPESRYRGAYDIGRKKYIGTENRGDAMTKTPLSIDDIMIETIFLGLRQRRGLQDLTSYQHYLVDDWEIRMQKLTDEGLVIYKNNTLSLTDIGMNIHHRICTYLMKEI